MQPVKWYDNIPILSYLVLRGRCRSCGSAFSIRYLIVELLTGLGWAGLFYVEVVQNHHGWPRFGKTATEIAQGLYPWQWTVCWLYHAVLISFLFAAAVCDLDCREIPLPLTLTGTLVGLIGAVLFPWPWPREVFDALPHAAPPIINFEWRDAAIGTGLYPWPVWGPLPAWLPPLSWQLGLATGVVGALVGTFLLRSIGFIFGKGLGKEALGVGDADLMMMAGAFLGWQPVVVAFFVSVFPALLFGLANLAKRGDNSLPFGPSLAAGVILTFLGWNVIGPFVQPFLFFPELMLAFAGVAAGFMFAASLLLRLLRRRA